MRRIISDFDGVIGNSLDVCLRVASQITSLFDEQAKVQSFQDYRKYLGKDGHLNSLDRKDAATLREVHRLLMRRYASDISIFNRVIEVYERLIIKPTIASSSYSRTITAALGNRSSVFNEIYGCDISPKEDVLSVLKSKHLFIYVTDTKTDVSRCRALNIPVIATTWGYDDTATLQESKPDYLINNPDEMLCLFQELKLTT